MEAQSKRRGLLLKTEFLDPIKSQSKLRMRFIARILTEPYLYGEGISGTVRILPDLPLLYFKVVEEVERGRFKRYIHIKRSVTRSHNQCASQVFSPFYFFSNFIARVLCLTARAVARSFSPPAAARKRGKRVFSGTPRTPA